jgi:hypothetical protein
MGRSARKKAENRRREAAREAASARPDWVATPAEGKADPGSADLSAYSDLRAQERLHERELGRVGMSMRLPREERWIPLRLVDFTSVGFGASIEPAATMDARSMQEPLLGRGATNAEAGGKRAPCPVAAGDEVEIRIQIRARHTFTVWCQVRNVAPWREGFRIGLRRLDVAFPQAVRDDKRGNPRLVLSPAVALKGRIRHPFLFGRECPLIVTDINKDLGLSLVSPDPTILLFEGMEIEIGFELAALRHSPMTARVTWVSALSEDEVRFGVECLTVDLRLHNAICDHLLYTQQWTPARLREAGFHGKQIKSHLRFTTVKTMEDYADVLYLRRDAYVGVGKRPEGTRPEKMSSPLDGKSRILMARHHGRLVGTMTYTFPASEETVLDTQAGFPGARYPVALPPKANLIEVARLCIDENYRGTDLLVGMFEHGLKHFLMSDRHWLITSATDELWPMYRKIGFTRLKASYRHPLLNNLDHHLIIAHRSAFLWGFGIDILVWNSVFADLIRYLMERKLVAIPGWMRPVIRIKLLFRPLARLLTDAKAKSAFRKHMESIRGRRSESFRPEKDTKGPESLYSGESEIPLPPEEPRKPGTEG